MATSPENISTGKLYLIPTFLGEQEPGDVLPASVIKCVQHLTHYIAENEKTARRFIKKVAPEKPQPELRINLLNKFTDPLAIPSFLDACLAGHDVGVVSEAGCPGIADPGAEIVRLAHEKNIRVVPLVGPSSILLTMMASGLNGQNFAFHGYLPIDKNERKQHLKKLERLSFELNQAQLFIETPYRNDKFLQDLLQNLHPQTNICIGCEVSLPTEFIKTKTVQEWKKTKVDLHKRPTLFIIQKKS